MHSVEDAEGCISYCLKILLCGRREITGQVRPQSSILRQFTFVVRKQQYFPTILKQPSKKIAHYSFPKTNINPLAPVIETTASHVVYDHQALRFTRGGENL